MDNIHANGHLTPKQERFVGEYLIDYNATQAAVRAGYSEKTAHAIGYQNLQKPAIQQAIKAALQRENDRLLISGEKILEGLMDIAFAEGEDSGVKPAERMRALELLGKHLGLFMQKGEGTEPVTVVIEDDYGA